MRKNIWESIRLLPSRCSTLEDLMPDDNLSSQYYSAIAIEHFQNPRNVGEIVDSDVEGQVVNPVCGDEVKFFFRLRKNKDAQERVIESVSFQASGCPATIATSSIATDMLIGLSLSEASQLTRLDYAEAVGGLPKSKQHCSVLAEAVVQQAVTNLRLKDQSSMKQTT